MHFEIHPLKQLIMQGEGPMLDFKKTISSAPKIAKTLVAFANCKGGRLLIGVRDNGAIVGVSVEEDLYMIESAAYFFCKPPIHYIPQVHKYNNCQVLEIYVPESNQKPHAAKGEDGKWWVYIRVNDQSVLASKIVVDVLRKENAQEGAKITYTSKESALLHYLAQHQRITLKEYCKLINISRRRAIKILVNLIQAGVIRVHHTEKTEFYTLS
ncbi:MAG: putative DNA binding domain-containing protein [Bacteroidia bacterium]|nr:putative DNA binding domain-containing protein [Bacteroidia bacterium]MDW8158481.1 putative DNA binding domain-containing protein [Bacteroidia bacterium]